MDLSAVTAALAADADVVLAWELDSDEDPTLSAFAVKGGTRQVAYSSVEPDERAAASKALLAAGHAQGWYASGTGCVWRATPERFAVWTAQGEALVADEQSVRLRDGEVVSRQEVISVIGFLDPGAVRRGVSIAWGEREVLLVEHYVHRASQDPSYGEFDAVSDTTWVRGLGRQLAQWLGARFVDRT